MTKERKALPYSAVIAVLAVLVVAAAVGIYLHYCKPSQRDILSGPQPPVAENMQPMLPAKPLSALPEPDQLRFADALRDAVATIKPDYQRRRGTVVHLHRWLGRWPRKPRGQYLGGEFGLRQDVNADSQTQVAGESVPTTSSGATGGRLRRQFDDPASSRRLESGRK